MPAAKGRPGALVLVLFSDASRIGLHPLRADLRLCLRLLGIGLPLAIGLGTLLAFIAPEVSDIWRALAIGAALAPTDADLRGHDGQPGGPGTESGG